MRRLLLSSSFAVLCGAFALAPVTASGDTTGTLAPVRIDVSGAHAPTFLQPMRVAGALEHAGNPVWLGQSLLPQVPRLLFGLASVAKPGVPVFDPSSQAWFASANGAIVRLEPDGRLVVVADGVQGLDIDVRAARSLAVSREPGDTIVLHRWGGASAGKVVLWRGAAFFQPRLSPDGSRILVSESRPEGGRVWVTEVGGTPRDLTQGYGATWHPDGRRVLFARIRHDARRITDSELWMADVVTGEQRMVAHPAVPAVEPCISPDGRSVAFLHGQTREVFVAAFDDPWQRNEVTP